MVHVRQDSNSIEPFVLSLTDLFPPSNVNHLLLHILRASYALGTGPSISCESAPTDSATMLKRECYYYPAVTDEALWFRTFESLAQGHQPVSEGLLLRSSLFSSEIHALNHCTRPGGLW